MEAIKTEDLKKIPHKYQIVFAKFCANQVAHLFRKPKNENMNAIFYAELAVQNSAHTANDPINAAYYAGYAAIYAARAAFYSISYVGRDLMIKQQLDCYNGLLNLDTNLENLLVK